MTRAILDTNVLVSALLFGGQPRELLALNGRRYHLVLSEPILDELRAVLAYPKFQKYGLNTDTIHSLTSTLARAAEMVEGDLHVPVFKPDPKDTPLLACALETGADFLVTGDRALLELGEYEGTRILTPRQFHDWLGSHPDP